MIEMAREEMLSKSVDIYRRVMSGERFSDVTIQSD